MASPARFIKPAKPSKVPSPQELGLPPKFDQYRHMQEEGIYTIVKGDKRIDTICAPTGVGKSLIHVAAALWSGKPTCIVTASRGLQAQYMDDFASIGMVNLMGRRNYKCDMRPNDPDYTCEEGRAAQCPYVGSISCSCTQAEMRAATSKLVVTNYEKWHPARRYGKILDHIEQVIFDEGHAAPEALAGYMQVQLYFKEVEEGLKIEMLSRPESDDMMEWKLWAQAARATAENAMLAAQARITGITNPKPSWVRHFNHMRNLLRRINVITTARADDWVVDEIEGGFQFDPIRPGRYCEAALLMKVPRVIFDSATIRPKTMFICGIGQQHFDFTEFESDFDPSRCPIYYIPTMRVDAKADSLEMLWIRLDQIAAKRQDRKGIIHTVSYARQQDILSKSRFAGRMIINEKGEPPSNVIELFRNSPPGTLLVSPSVGTGYDFPGDQCRWQFMSKIPFEPPSKIVKAREADDPEYRSYKAMQALVQAFGRDMRSKTDWSERFIGDDHMAWFKPRYAHLAPKSFHAVYKSISIVPQPPKLDRA